MTPAEPHGDCGAGGSDAGRSHGAPSDEQVIQHLGAAVLLCWDELPFHAQTKILAQANDIIGLTPIPEARTEIVKLLLRHGKA